MGGVKQNLRKAKFFRRNVFHQRQTPTPSSPGNSIVSQPGRLIDFLSDRDLWRSFHSRVTTKSILLVKTTRKYFTIYLRNILMHYHSHIQEILHHFQRYWSCSTFFVKVTGSTPLQFQYQKRHRIQAHSTLLQANLPILFFLIFNHLYGSNTQPRYSLDLSFVVRTTKHLTLQKIRLVLGRRIMSQVLETLEDQMLQLP